LNPKAEVARGCDAHVAATSVLRKNSWKAVIVVDGTRTRIPKAKFEQLLKQQAADAEANKDG
jgi:hypothetical protein